MARKLVQEKKKISLTSSARWKTGQFFLSCMYGLRFNLLVNSGFSISLSVVQEWWWLEGKLACTRAQNRRFFGNLIVWRIRQCQANKTYEREPKNQLFKITIIHLNEIKSMHIGTKDLLFYCYRTFRSKVQERKGLQTFIFETPNFSKRN